MILKENPITGGLHNLWRKRIQEYFAAVDFDSADDFLSLIQYIENTPERFYNSQCAYTYYSFLLDLKASNVKLLVDLLSNHHNELSIANKILNEVNQKNIHDIFCPKEDNELFDFIDEEVHYNYLKIIEGPFFQFIRLAAIASRLKRNAGIDKLDLFNCVDELKKGDFSFILDLYNNTIRNGIAHGKVIFKDNDILYKDKSNTKEIPTKDIITKFDNLLDAVNGFALGLKLFYFSNPNFLRNNKIEIPQSILIEELKAQVNSPGWNVVNCLDGYASTVDKKQLIIYTNNTFWDFIKVYYNAYRTVVWAEKFSSGYERFFLKLNSKHSLNGWAGFDGIKLKQLREAGANSESSYAGVLENNLLFFVPKIKFPKFIYKLGTLKMALKLNYKIAWADFRSKVWPRFYEIRTSKAHAKKNFACIEMACAVIDSKYVEQTELIIRKKYKAMIKAAKKHAKKQSNMMSGVRLKPVKFVRLFVYDTDFRVRGLQYSGLIEELVCSIQINSSKIKNVDLLGGTPEQLGKYRIVWNKKWLEKTGLKM